MKRILPVVVASLVAVSVFHAGDAHALGPIDVEVAGKVGVGTNPNDGPTPYGFGVGGRGGITVLGGIYGGVNAMYYTGGSQDILTTHISNHSFLYGFEGGYGIKILLLTIRPQLGLGVASFSSSTGDASNSNSYLYLEPGVTGLVAIGSLLVGADLNYLLIPSVTQADGSSKTYGAMTVHGQIGLRF